jgi:hypothetical protein
MRATSGTGVDFLLEQLRWSLGQPLIHGDRAWAARVGRILDRLASAFDAHVNEVLRPGGILEDIAGAGLLPFTAEAREVARLRQRHERARERLLCAAAQFRGALGLFPPSAHSSEDGEPTRAAQATWAYSLFRALTPCVADVLADVSACVAAERSLLGLASEASEELLDRPQNPPGITPGSEAQPHRG